MEGQMVAVLALSLFTLFAALMGLEAMQHDTALETAEGAATLDRLERLFPVLERIDAEDVPSFLDVASSCHAGYAVSDEPFAFDGTNAATARLESRIARALGLDAGRVRIGHARLDRDEFAYSKCSGSEIDLPIDGIVVGVRLTSGRWFNAEVHPHEWHFREKLDWMLRATGVFVLVGAIAIFFMHRVSKPLNSLTAAAQRFGAGLQVSSLEEDGPADLRRAVRAFNTMQRQVTDELARRTNTLAAISHDVRTPLTALRIKAELIDDGGVRRDIVASIDRMEAITASALEFLRGESRSELPRPVNLGALLESECADFEAAGEDVAFVGDAGIRHTCRPEALARALRNLIDNAVKYGGRARVAVRRGVAGVVDISVADDGPGIPDDQRARAVEPFVRLSAARGNDGGGFGLGLAVAKAVAEGHGGELVLAANEPHGLIATIRLPAAAS
jgi:signal transduction histidine kinase